MALDLEQARTCIERKLADNGRESVEREMRQLQTAVYVMAGGGFVGSSLATQPKNGYVDGRCSKRPYAIGKIKNVLAVLCIYAELLGYDPNSIEQEAPGKTHMDCHNCDVW